MDKQIAPGLVHDSTPKGLRILENSLVVHAHDLYKRELERLLPQFVAGGIKTLQSPLPLRATAYLPVALAEIFHVDDSRIVTDACLAQLYLNHYAHLVDFATDERSVADPILLHASSLILAKAIVVYGSFNTLGRTFWTHWETYGSRASMAERDLWRHRHTLLPYNQDDFNSMGDKSALLISTAALYAALTDQWALLQEVEPALARTFLAVQLMDDLLDWESDLAAGIYTYPLWLASRHSSLLSPSEIAVQLVRGRVAETVTERAIDELTESLCRLRPLHAKSFGSLVEALLLSLVQLLTQLQDDASRVLECPSEYDIRKYLRTIIDDRLAH